MVPSRRETLAAAGALLVGSLAGCLAPGDPGGSGDGDGDTDGPSGTDDDPPSDTDDPGDGDGTGGSADHGEAPEYDCALASRPPAAPVDDASEPADASRYPAPPEDPTDDDAVASYVTAHEVAFRRNALVQQYDDRLMKVGVSPGGTRSFDAPDGASVVRVSYHYYFEYAAEEAGTDETPVPIHADSATTWATYYVDGEAAVRAETTGPLDDESALVPDPWRSGEPVVCFG
jgi:hypothetical protein